MTNGKSNVKLGRNDPCWCGSGKKLKKCHGHAPVDKDSKSFSVNPKHTSPPITTHFVGNARGSYVERPGLLKAVVVTKPIDSTDEELHQLRQAWGKKIETAGLHRLAERVNHMEHKLRGVRYHRDNYIRGESAAIQHFQTDHTPPAGAAIEELRPELLFEVEGFLYQVKSSLDMLARLLSDIGLGSVGHSFGDRGDRLLRQLDSVPTECKTEAAELKALIEVAQPRWIDQTISFRDSIAHIGMLKEFCCFVQVPFIGGSEAEVHYPVMPGGERVASYLDRVENELRQFADRGVTIAIRMAANSSQA